MPDYFLSDVHLRHDRPDRGRRLARLVNRLAASDPLTIVGDLCDFWLAARQARRDPLACPGLRSLADYRTRGGRLTILGGNHDGRLADYYRRVLDPDWVDDALRVESHGLRLHLAHGHRLGARSPWKALMEGDLFLQAFGALPGAVARRLEQELERTNRAQRDRLDPRHLAVLRGAADRLGDEVDAMVVGHVHMTFDDRQGRPRLIVLGSWHHRPSYLRVDDDGARLILEDESGAETVVGGIATRTDG